MGFSQVQNIPVVASVIKILFTGFLSFVFAFLMTPVMTHFLYKYKIGIKIKKNSVDGEKLTYVSELHKHKNNTPVMGGILVWATVSLLALASHYLFPLLADLWSINFLARLDFMSRKEVWLPLFALVSAGILGLCDDFASVRGIGSNKGGGIRFLTRFGWLILIAGLGAWWFYYKLGWDRIHIPALGDFSIGHGSVGLSVRDYGVTRSTTNVIDSIRCSNESPCDG